MEGLMMRGIDFGVVFAASGTLNFFGQGWQFHRLYKTLFSGRFNFDQTTFVAKTSTLFPRPGNMPLKNNLMSRSLFPKCVKVCFVEGVVLNAVGLSGPGLYFLLRAEKWQKRRQPFEISLMSIGQTKVERLNESKLMVDLIEEHMPGFQSPFAVQVNVSCPNTGHPTAEMISESLKLLEVYQKPGVPIDLKIGVADALEAGVDYIKEIEASGLCDCITCSNTIPWGKLPYRINWTGLFGSGKSPLAHLGGGGLSGWPLQRIVLDWVRQVRDAGISLPIKAGGGILKSKDVADLYRAGANAIEIGSVAILRPWRVRNIIQTGNMLFGKW